MKTLTHAAELSAAPTRQAHGRPQVQSRWQSLIETMVQTTFGFITNFAAGFVIYPMVGMPMPAVSNLLVTLLFTLLSLKRGYCLRRFFVWYWARGRG